MSELETEDLTDATEGVESNGALLIFGWLNVVAFAEAVNAARASGTALPPQPLHLPTPVDTQTFMEVVMEYARSEGASSRVGTACLPCSLVEFAQVVVRLTRLDVDPWVRHIVGTVAPASISG